MTKIAIVTGASSGIGRATALQLAARGVGVILTYNGNEQGAREAAREADGVALRLDVGASETFPAFVEQVRAVLRERWARDDFDHLVNNAGLGGGAPFAATSEEQFDAFYRVLLHGPYFLTQALLPLIADGGAIVNTTSNASRRPESGFSAYATMKGGLTTLTRYLALELGARGIRVNGVAPGPTRTRLGGDAFEKYPEVIPPLVARTVLGRLGEGDDIGKVIAAVLSDDFAWVTGENLEVSGGFNL